MYYCYQLFNNDCGYACLKMCLANVYHNKNYLKLVKEYQEDDYSMYDLINIASSYNVELKGYEIEDVNELYKNNNFICLIRENELNHYVYFVKKTKSNIVLFDPNYGIRKLDEKEFLSLFQNKILLVKSKGNDILKKIKEHKNLFYYLFFFVINLFDFILLTMGTYYVNSSSSLILVFLMICVFMITRINKFVFIEFYMQSFDKKYIFPFINNENFSKYSYKIITEYKSTFISHISEKVNCCSTLFFLCYIFISDSLYHLFMIGIIFVINLAIFIIKNKNDEKIKIQILEEELFTKEDRLNTYKKMQFQIKNYVFKESFVQIFVFIYSFILVFFKMSFSKIDSFIYLIFYTIGYVELSKNIFQIFSFKKNNLEFNKKKSLFDLVFYKNSLNYENNINQINSENSENLF